MILVSRNVSTLSAGLEFFSNFGGFGNEELMILTGKNICAPRPAPHRNAPEDASSENY